MYKYRINGKDVQFEKESDMMAAVEAARKKGYSVEVISEPESSDNFMTEKTPEEQLRATQLEASGGVAGTNESLQENFIQDPVESADVVSETVALKDTELPQADTSLDLLLSNIPKVEEPPVLEEKEKEIPKFELEKKEDIIIDGPLGLIDPPKVGSSSGKFPKKC